MSRVTTYRAFGLNIQSEIPLPELPETGPEGMPDAFIRWGAIGHGISSPLDHGVLWKTALGQFEINIPEVARYLVTQGRDIIVEPHQGVNEASLRTYLLGSATGALLQQRGYFVLHAGGFVHNGNAILVSGRSGAGKSTTLQGMARRGYATLSDDLIPIHTDSYGMCIASPGYPFTRLCRDAADHYGIGSGSPRFLVKSGRKLVLSIESFEATPRPVSHIFFLKSKNRETVETKPIDILKASALLSKFAYRGKFLKGMRLLPPHFDFTVRVARQAQVTVLHRPATLGGLESVLDKMEELIDQPQHG